MNTKWNNWKAVILSIAGIIVMFNANAQFAFSMGAKGGVTFTHLNGNDKGSQTCRKGWVGGIYTQFALAKAFAIQPEFLIHEKGAQRTVSGQRTNLKINYFEIPVLFKLRLPIGNVYPNIFAGPSFAYRVSANYTSVNTTSNESSNISVSNIKKMDTGGIVGAGVDIRLSHLFLTLDGRYGFGFSKLGDGYYSLDVHNRNWTVMGGIGFILGK